MTKWVIWLSYTMNCKENPQDKETQKGGSVMTWQNG